MLLPGQREFERRQERSRDGIPLHAAVFTVPEALAGEPVLPHPSPCE